MKDKKLSKEQKRMETIINYFQEYVNKYNDVSNPYTYKVCDETFILDMIYGIGIAINNK